MPLLKTKRLGKIKTFFILLLSFWVSLAIVYAIPANLLRPHLEESHDIVAEEGKNPESYVRNGPFDNHTVILMLNHAAQASGNPFVEALESPAYDNGNGKSDPNSLAASIDGETNSNYTRYWHGYLVVLKPLLIFFNVEEIRLLFQSVFFVLLGCACLALYRSLGRLGIGLSVALCLSMGLIGGADAAATLPIFFSFAISLASTIWIAQVPLDELLGRPKINFKSLFNSKLSLGFMVVGALTVFFDFLDNPILTLGIPLAVLVCRTAKTSSLSRILSYCAISAIFWLIGYSLFWVSKWALASLVLGVNVFENGMEAVAFRTGSTDQARSYGGFRDALRSNLAYLGFSKWFMKIALVLLIAYLLTISVISIKRHDSKPVKEGGKTVFLLMLVAFLSLIWYMALPNHSIIHAGKISYRTLEIALFAEFSAVSWAINDLMIRLGLSKRLLKNAPKKNADRNARRF